jgi:uncharacterized Zn-binding protein involved in type VI secretion
VTLPAARLSDPTMHGGVIVAGAPTVIIGGKPSARIGDMHTCALVTGLVPHVGGPICLGSFTVLVSGMPAARQTDLAICVGPPDSIAMGEPTVLIGMAGGGGLMGMLKGLVMAGLATLKQLMGGGYPRAVMKNGQIVTEYNSFITIEGTPEYQAKVVRDLNTIANTKAGQKLLKSLESSGKTVRIHTDRSVKPDGTIKTGNYAWTDPPPSGSPPYAGYKDGGGANTQIGYDPDRDRLAGNPDAWANPPNRPPEVGLFHEMTHCDDFTHGRLDSTTQVANGTKTPATIPDSEARAVGLPPHDKDGYSENDYREEQGLVKRPYY